MTDMLSNLATLAAERLDLPDAATRAAINLMVSRTARKLSVDGQSDAAFVADMQSHPIAVHTQAANAQHYELPPEFFGHVLGPHRKYSSCLYAAGDDTLEAAEARALTETACHAALEDGQRILELGCGWGSLSLWMAQRFPASRITAVSNSHGQRGFIEAEARRRGLHNLTVITADMNAFTPDGVFDRIVSVEMFEHMANWHALLARVHGWLAPEGRVFLHVFTHRDAPYRFDHGDQTDWIAQHFFTGGLMPSHGLITQFRDLFAVEDEWRWAGRHYERTALAWLENFDRNRNQVDALLTATYGRDAAVWRRRWRLFFLAVAGLFGHAGGHVWGVSHYRLRPA
jgi:cyclopropane-fatty-acyl-phospholipid synthase